MNAVKWNAEDYHLHSPAQHAWALELIANLNIKGDERVLDLGCGDGKITAEIAQRVPEGSVVGVDNSQEMIDFAGSRFPVEAFSNLSFLLKDVRALDFNAEFDVVFSSSVLHWIADQRTVLEGLFRALKPDGRILLQMGGRGNAAELFEIVETLLTSVKWARYFIDFTPLYRFHGPEEYSEWLVEAGLTPVCVELIPKDMTYSNKDGLAAWVRTTWLPYTQRVPESLREEFILEMVDRYLVSHPSDAAGRVHVSMVRLEVEALKTAA